MSENKSWRSYPKIFHVGRSELQEVLSKDILIEEKIDGSQFSWGVFNNELICRSKSVQLNMVAPEKMFIDAIKTIQAMHSEGKLKEGWTYRAEYLQRPRHNALCYDRIPKQHLIGFDINRLDGSFCSYEEKSIEFERLDLETVPLIFVGKLNDYSKLRDLLELTSILGKQKIEGVVIKQYELLDKENKPIFGKFVSEEFKEINRGGGVSKESNEDFIGEISNKYKTSARWNKAIQHLRDQGILSDSPFK